MLSFQKKQHSLSAFGGEGLELDDLEDPFQPRLFYDSMILKTNSFIGWNVIDAMLSSWSGEYWISCSERCEYPYLLCISLDSIAAHDGVGCDLSLLAEIT